MYVDIYICICIYINICIYIQHVFIPGAEPPREKERKCRGWAHGATAGGRFHFNSGARVHRVSRRISE